MLNNYTNLLPYRDYSEHSVLNMYSLNGTGVGGLFVTFETGQQDPALSAGQYSATNVGASYAGTWSKRYENPRKVKYSAAEDTKGAVAGLMLYGTAEYDNNGNRLILDPKVRNDELGVVNSGQTTPIATQGQFSIKSDAYINTPYPGYLGVIAGTGKLRFVAPDIGYYQSGLAVCKVLSTSGNAFGGYCDIQLTLG